MAELEVIQKAFPVEIRGEVNSLLAKFAIETKHSTIGFETVMIGQEKLEIPQRIYYSPPYSLTNSKFTQKEQEILNCIFSRHNNGFIRQKAVQNIVGSSNNWTVPYIVKIIGEYVIEILNDIENNFEILNKPNLVSFVQQNPEFYNRTRSRVGSYWDCYFRRHFPEILNGVRVSEKQRYVGFRLLNKIDKLINEK